MNESKINKMILNELENLLLENENDNLEALEDMADEGLEYLTKSYHIAIEQMKPAEITPAFFLQEHLLNIKKACTNVRKLLPTQND